MIAKMLVLWRVVLPNVAGSEMVCGGAKRPTGELTLLIEGQEHATATRRIYDEVVSHDAALVARSDWFKAEFAAGGWQEVDAA